MALEKCRECGGDVSSEAKNCPHCGTPIPQPKGGSPGCLWWALTGLAVIFVLLMLAGKGGNGGGNYTYADLAKDKAEECVRKKGFGEWRGSMGVSLEKFCEGVGNLAALKQHRADHPEKY